MLCRCSTVFFSLFQCCSMNDSSQQWLTRPVSTPKVTVNSWKIEPLLRRGKNKAPHNLQHLHTQIGRGRGVSEADPPPPLDAHIQNIKPCPPETFVWHWWASIIQSELWSSAWHPKVTAPQTQTGVQTSTHYCVILSLKSQKSLKICVFILERSGSVISWRAKAVQVPHSDYLWMFNDTLYFFFICHIMTFLLR